MIKIGDKVAHFMTLNKWGIVVDFIRENQQYMSVGGTMEYVSYAVIKTPSDELIKYKTADLMKVYE